MVLLLLFLLLQSCCPTHPQPAEQVSWTWRNQ
jgi:hypothetical protein